MKNIFIFTGTDDFLFNQKLNIVLKKYIPDEAKAFAFRKYIVGEGEEKEIVNEVSTLPFGSSYKCVVVKSFDRMEKNALLLLIKECVDECFLFLQHSDTKLNAGKLKTWLNVKPSKVEHISLKAPNAYELCSRIRMFLNNKKISFQEQAVREMGNHLVMQPELLKGELEKIEFFLKDRSEGLTIPLLRSILSSSQVVNVYQVTNYIFLRQKSASLKALMYYIKQAGNFILLHSILNKETHQLLKYKELSANASQDEVFKKIGIYYGSHRSSFLEKVNRFDYNELCQWVEGMNQLEQILKSDSVVDDRVGSTKVNQVGLTHLQKMILSFCH